MAVFNGSEVSSGAAVVGATEELALEQEDGEVKETDDGAFETEGEVELHSFWDRGGIETSAGFDEERFLEGSRSPKELAFAE